MGGLSTQMVFFSRLKNEMTRPKRGWGRTEAANTPKTSNLLELIIFLNECFLHFVPLEPKKVVEMGGERSFCGQYRFQTAQLERLKLS